MDGTTSNQGAENAQAADGEIQPIESTPSSPTALQDSPSEIRKDEHYEVRPRHNSVLQEVQYPPSIVSTPDSPTAPDHGLIDASDAPKKKKKKTKSRPGKTLRAVTGFEEFYADGPTTPAEHAAEQTLYCPEFPIAQRIENAIQRFRQKRRLDSARSLLFDKYLTLGGVDSSQRMFQGFDPSEVKDLSADEIREMTARDVIHTNSGNSKFYDAGDPGDWTVDFVTIVKGFLSCWVPREYTRGDSAEDIHANNIQAAELIHNFLSYLQMHDVCPEYDSQIITAKTICNAAPLELRQVRELQKELQDPFNTAAKFLFSDNGVYEAVNDSSNNDAAELQEEYPGQDPSMRTRKLNPFFQLVIFRLSIMEVNKTTDHLAASDDPTNIRIVSTKIQEYLVVRVGRRKKKEKYMFERLLENEGLLGKVKPAGTLTLEPTVMEHAYSDVPRPDKREISGPVDHFIIDDEVLAKVQLGMTLQLEVCKLNIGVYFIKKVLDVRVSFDTLLPQSLMLKWREPAENERPAPSVDNPDVEELKNGAEFED